MTRKRERTRTVLVVDDDDRVAQFVAIRLRALGFRCITVNTCAQARHEFRTHRIDLVVADLHLAGDSGVALAHSIGVQADVPFVFITGMPTAFEHQLLCMPDPIVLPKPFDAVALSAAVQRALGLSCEEAA